MKLCYHVLGAGGVDADRVVEVLLGGTALDGLQGNTQAEERREEKRQREGVIPVGHVARVAHVRAGGKPCVSAP